MPYAGNCGIGRRRSMKLRPAEDDRALLPEMFASDLEIIVANNGRDDYAKRLVFVHAVSTGRALGCHAFAGSAHHHRFALRQLLKHLADGDLCLWGSDLD